MRLRRELMFISVLFQIQRMVISGGSFKPDTLKPKEVVSLLLDDDEIGSKCKYNIQMINVEIQFYLFVIVLLELIYHNCILQFNKRLMGRLMSSG